MMMLALDWLRMRPRPARHSSMPDPLRIPLAHLTAPPDPSRRFRLMEVVRRKLRERRYSRRTEEAYVYWIRRYIGSPRPASSARPRREPMSQAFYRCSRSTDNVAASTQNQALAALKFLYDRVLDRPLGPHRRHQPQRVGASVFRWFSASARCARSWPRCRSRPALCIADVRWRPSRAGVRVASGKGRRSRSARDRGSRRQGGQGSSYSPRRGVPRAAQASAGREPSPVSQGRACRCANDGDLPGTSPQVSERRRGMAVAATSSAQLGPCATGTVFGAGTTITRSALQRSVANAVRAAGITKRATCHSLAALVCDASSRGRGGYSNRTDALGAHRHSHDDDLHARSESRGLGCPEPGGFAVGWWWEAWAVERRRSAVRRRL